MSPRRRSAAGLAGCSVLLVVAVAGLHAVGGEFAPPPVRHPGAIGAWVAERQPAQVSFALLRLVALAMGWYLLAVTVAGTASRLLRLAMLVKALDVVTMPAVRRALSGAVGLSMVTTVVAGPAGVAAAGEAGAPPPVEVMRRLPDAEADADAAAEAPPVIMRRLPDTGGAPPAPPTPPTWTVAPGDSFWSVAERLVAQASPRAPSDAEIAPYWRRLVEHNRSRLRDPANADLLFPGQVLVVPGPVAGEP